MSAKARPKAVEAWALYDGSGNIYEMHRSRRRAQKANRECYVRHRVIRVRITPAPSRKR